MDIPLLILSIPLVLLFLAGIYMVVGTLRGVGSLVNAPEGWESVYPYKLVKKMGPRGVSYLHIFEGTGLIIGSIVVLAYLFL